MIGEGGGVYNVAPHFFSAPGTRYLPIGRGNEAEKFIYMADEEPVRKQLHRRLHLLGNEKVLDSFCHPSAAKSVRGTRGKLPFWGAQGDALLATNLKCCIKILGGGVSSALTPPSCISPGEAAPDQDAAQGVLLALHCHGGAHLQITKGIKAGSTLWCLPGHITKIRALDGVKKRQKWLKKATVV